MSHDPREIANFLLDQADSTQTSITNLKLLKLIFFAHGWYLAEFQQPLVGEEFQAWKHGPVLPSVYYAFKEFGSRPITGRAKAIDLASGKRQTIIPKLDENIESFLRIIFQFYLRYHAIELSNMTHKKGAPWDIVWSRFESRINTGMYISDAKIQSYFAKEVAIHRRH